MSKDTENYHRILNLLDSVSPHALNAKDISRRLNMPYNTVRSYLSRLYNSNAIKRVHRGLYRSILDVDALRRASAAEDIDIRLHGIKLEGRLCIKEHGGRFLDADAFTPQGECVFDNDFRETFKTLFEGRLTTITIHRAGKGKGLVEVFLKSSKLPMSILEFMRWEAFLHGVFPNFELMGWKCIQIGLNCDFRRLRLDGVKSIKLQTFKNAWFQVYQKAEDILRIEGHLVTEIDLGEALEILSTIVRRPRPKMDRFEDDGAMFG